ncbi:MAG: TIGR00300 family protein [Nitrosopumilus sp.]|nr:TIGR00300 family protein [Nitrosopumilus sp.]CAI9831303.1 conserved hypothetical protein [Nitrosopumilaceae archaeon]MDA7940957.1 TIGR00300 family protein [Nitrosopumilus sp.]MDA7943187.1 TIGR00300 family protein [Nitrosopumilus sp.]MDA7944320.1 TIGR00300 family protein [Nitrosopumilus sp.]
MAESGEIEARGHLIDSLILGKIFDGIMDLGGQFNVLEIDVGRRKRDASYVRMSVTGRDRRHLGRLLAAAYREGAVPVDGGEAELARAPRDCVMPDGFYSTTNNRTQVLLGGRWIEVENMMMDKCVVVRGRRAACTPVRDVRRGDMVVVGDRGVRITPPERPRSGVNVFEFMGSSSSSERPTRRMARSIASDMRAVKGRGGRIVAVAGPAVVHTGAAGALADLVRLGYVDGLLAGNALAVHDIELAILGTSLGLDARSASPAERGHRNHMDTINEVFKAGSIPRMVSSGRLRSGIMYECVKKGVPFVLAGSIRDDGPLPGVVTDVTDAQRQYKRVLRGADMVLMISTMLHSIAVGNMLPADVKVVVMDISQPTVTKLMDRGTWQALGVVTDVGAFLPMVAGHLGKRPA